MKGYLRLGGIALVAGCSGSPAADEGTANIQIPEFEPPVAINAEPPVSYPPRLFRDGVEGTVVLLLFVNETGKVILDSTRIQDGSGYAALDSAVLAGVDAMEFAPARRNGQAVATWFLQPIHFRQPDAATSGGGL
jgi:protein TonB